MQKEGGRIYRFQEVALGTIIVIHQALAWLYGKGEHKQIVDPGAKNSWS
jgi:hypothetical protein